MRWRAGRVGALLGTLGPVGRVQWDRRREIAEVTTESGATARAVATGARRPLRASSRRSVIAHEPPAPDDANPARSPAWTEDRAAAAAHRRWRDRDRRTWTLHSVETTARAEPGAEVLAMAALRERLGQRGAHRLDVRIAHDDPRLSWFDRNTWHRGPVGTELILSAPVHLPDDLDPRGRTRMQRRVRSLRHGDLIRRTTILLEDAARSMTPGSRATRGAAPMRSALPTGASPHERTRFRVARHALDLVPPGFRRRGFLDVGCGDGRVLTLARSLGLAPVHGIEIDPDLARRAQIGLAPGAVTCADATDLPIPAHVGTVYLFNPFDAGTTSRFARRLGESLARTPRPLLILYVNPRYPEAFLDVGFELVHAELQFSVLLHEPGDDRPSRH